MLRRYGGQVVAAAQVKLIWACPTGPRAPAEDRRPGLWRPADRVAYQVRHAREGDLARPGGALGNGPGSRRLAGICCRAACACIGCGVMAETDVIRTPDQRLRVFVSSTLQELAVERQAVRDAVTRLRLVPVMFELGARPHPPRQVYRSYLAQSHRHPGQDHDHPPARERRCTGAGVPAAVVGTVGTRIARGGRHDRAHHPRGARPARPVRRDARARRRGLRDGGLEPRPGDGPRRRLRLRRRGLPQPRPRPPRLPRRHGRLLRREGRRSSRPSTPGAALVNVDDEWGRRLVDAGDRAGARRCRRRRRDADWRATDVELRPAGATFRVARARGRRRRPACPIPGDVQRRQHARRGRRARRGRVRRRRGRRRRSPAAPACPGRLERIDEGQDFAVVVDYAHKPDAVAAALAHAAPARPGPPGRRDRRRRRPRPRQAPVDGRDRRAGSPTCWSSPTTTRAARTPRRSGPRSWPAPRGGRAEVLEIGDRRAAIAEAVAPRPARRRRPGRRQGARDRPGGRRRRAPLRRPRGGARGAPRR